MFDLQEMTPVLFRNNSDEYWRPGFFKEIRSGYFVSTELLYYCEIALLDGNEKRIGTSEEAFNSYDRSSLL